MKNLRILLMSVGIFMMSITCLTPFFLLSKIESREKYLQTDECTELCASISKSLGLSLLSTIAGASCILSFALIPNKKNNLKESDNFPEDGETLSLKNSNH